MNKNEERKAPRYKIRVPVEFESGDGLTRDCSALGIFIETDRSFSLGQLIEFTLILRYVDKAGPVRVKCLGKIVRVEERGKTGIAARINSWSFEAGE